MKVSDQIMVIEYVAKLMHIATGSPWQWAHLPLDTREGWRDKALMVLNTSGIADCLNVVPEGSDEMFRMLLRARNSREVLDKHDA